MLVYVIDDDRDFAEVVAGFVREAMKGKCNHGGVNGDGDAGGAEAIRVKIFSNALTAIAEIDKEVPEMIFLDVLLDGPDGFTFLHELRSYPDLAKVPVVIISSLDFDGQSLSEYGVVACLNKSEMRPEQIRELVLNYA